MNGPSNKFLTRAALTMNHHAGASRGDFQNELPNRIDGWAVANQRLLEFRDLLVPPRVTIQAARFRRDRIAQRSNFAIRDFAGNLCNSVCHRMFLYDAHRSVDAPVRCSMRSSTTVIAAGCG